MVEQFADSSVGKEIFVGEMAGSWAMVMSHC